MKNKKILAFGALLVIIFGVAPYFLGNIAKDNIEKQADLISSTPGYSLKIREYDQGWFTSHAVIAYGFDQHTIKVLKKSAKEDIDKNIINILKDGFVFDLEIAHGPVTFQNGVNLALLTMVGQLANTESQSGKTLDLFSSVSYGGATEININSPSLKIDYSDMIGQKMVVDYSDINLEASINAAVDEYDLHFAMDQLTLNMEGVSIAFEQFDLNANGQKINDYLWLGEGNSTAKKFNFNSTKDKNISLDLDGLNSNYIFRKENDTALTMHLGYNSDTLVVSGINFKDIMFDMDINHLNIEATTDYVKSIQEIYKNSDGKKLDPKDFEKKSKIILARAGEKALKDSPEVIINSYAFSMEDGSFNSDGKITFDGDGLENIQQLSDPVTLNKRLAVVANVNFNKSLAKAMTGIAIKKQLAAGGVDISSMPAEQLDQMIEVQTTTALQGFVNNGYIKQDGENYTTNFEMQNGQRLINGKTLAIPGM
ncbi:MAG: YdgA family protein [Emcibacter sp.]|nr:YdgA family protein [Emcibacter sp.]